MIEAIYNFDYGVLDWIQAHLRCSFLDATLPWITRLANAGIFFIICAAVMLIFKRTRKTGASVAFALILGLLVCNLTIKPIVARVRPYENPDFVRDIELLIPKEKDFSFPSGHTIAAFEFATAVVIRDRRWGIAATALAVVIAFSRLYLYVHYPTDVFTSVVLGIVFGVLGTLIANAIRRKFSKSAQTR